MHGCNRIGGVKWNITEEQAKSAVGTLSYLDTVADKITKAVLKDSTSQSDARELVVSAKRMQYVLVRSDRTRERVAYLKIHACCASTRHTAISISVSYT